VSGSSHTGSAERERVDRRTLVEASHALPLVSMLVAQRSGAAVDPAGLEGAARLTARLMRRTGGGLQPQVLDARIDSLGASLSAEVSHSTVTFHATVIGRSLEPFCDVLEDVLGRPGLGEEELERLQRETQSELVEALDNDRALVRRWFQRRLFPDHPFGRPVSGTLSTVGAVRRADVLSLFTTMMRADALVFAFAGDIEAERAESIAARLARALPTGDTLPDAVSEPSTLPGRRLVLVDKPERTQTQILIGGLGTHPHDDDHMALHVANTIFGGTFTARMTREIRSERGWSYGAYSSLPIDRHRRSFSMWTFPKAVDAAACIRLELDMLRQWRDQGVTPEELEWAKSYLVKSHAFSVDTAAKRVSLALDELIYELPDDYYRDYTDRIQAVTLDQANQAVRNRIPEDDLLITVVGTEANIGGSVRDAVPDLTSVEVIPFDTE
jgi:zinc protease